MFYLQLQLGTLFYELVLVSFDFSYPLPEPPPAGELRKVKLNFRCSSCGSEVRMTVATDESPDPPRHCMSEMDLVIEDE